MAPMVEEVEGAGPIRVMVSHLAKVTTSRATEATARAPTTTLARTTREATAATAKASQVGPRRASVAVITATQTEEENFTDCTVGKLTQLQQWKKMKKLYSARRLRIIV